MEFEVQSCSTVNGNHITSFDGGKLAFNTPRRKVLNMSSGLCSHESWKTSGILCFFCVFFVLNLPFLGFAVRLRSLQ